MCVNIEDMRKKKRKRDMGKKVYFVGILKNRERQEIFRYRPQVYWCWWKRCVLCGTALANTSCQTTHGGVHNSLSLGYTKMKVWSQVTHLCLSACVQSHWPTSTTLSQQTHKQMPLWCNSKHIRKWADGCRVLISVINYEIAVIDR